MSECKFNALDYPYTFGMDRVATHTQSKCANCGRWTVYINKKTGASFNLCDGREDVMARLREENNV